MNAKTEATFFTKFVVVGVIGTILDFTMSNLFLLLINTGNPNVDLRIATTISYIIAVMINFLFNRYWIYPNSQGQKRKQVIQFYVVYTISLLIRVVIISIAFPIWQGIIGQFVTNNVDTIASNLALASTIAFTMIWNSTANRLWTFGDVQSGAQSASPSVE